MDQQDYCVNGVGSANLSSIIGLAETNRHPNRKIQQKIRAGKDAD
jgi:hypothetical protein